MPKMMDLVYEHYSNGGELGPAELEYLVKNFGDVNTLFQMVIAQNRIVERDLIIAKFLPMLDKEALLTYILKNKDSATLIKAAGNGLSLFQPFSDKSEFAGLTPLMVAINNKDMGMFSVLMGFSKTLNINYVCPSILHQGSLMKNETALSFAILTGNNFMAQTLIATQSVDVTLPDNKPLFHAIKADNSEMSNLLFSKMSGLSSEQKTAILLDAIKSDNFKAVEFLVNKGLSLDHIPMSVIHKAYKEHKDTMADYLLEKKAVSSDEAALMLHNKEYAAVMNDITKLKENDPPSNTPSASNNSNELQGAPKFETVKPKKPITVVFKLRKESGSTLEKIENPFKPVQGKLENFDSTASQVASQLEKFIEYELLIKVADQCCQKTSHELKNELIQKIVELAFQVQQGDVKQRLSNACDKTFQSSPLVQQMSPEQREVFKSSILEQCSFKGLNENQRDQIKGHLQNVNWTQNFNDFISTSFDKLAQIKPEDKARLKVN